MSLILFSCEKTKPDNNNHPNDPMNPSPSNYAKFISTNIILAWECSDPDSDSLCYDVYLGKSTDPQLVKSELKKTSYTPNILDIEETYYWKIVAKDDHNNHTTGDIWQFETGFEWCEVPAGEYSYGNPAQTRNIYYDYEIMKYEVTNQQYLDFLVSELIIDSITVTNHTVEGYYKGDEFYPSGTYEFLDLDDPDCKIDWNGTSFNIITGFENHPVIEVTWFGSWAFCNNYGFRLPTEYEWEKAARGNTESDYSWGSSINSSRANYWDSGDPWDNGTTPVGIYNGQTIQGFSTFNTPSPYGVYDMVGNVWEWTNSWLTDAVRQDRGGSWSNHKNTDFLKVWSRNGSTPQFSDSRNGFRCVIP